MSAGGGSRARGRSRRGELGGLGRLGALVVAGVLAGACIETPRGAAGRGEGTVERTVTVVGEGRASQPPSRANLTLGVQVVHARPEVALTEVSTKVNALVEALLVEDIARTDITTLTYRLVPEVVRDEQGRPSGKTQYRMIQTFDVVVRDLQRLPTIVGAAARAGITNVDDIQFGVSSPETLAERARIAAMNDARDKAEVLAQQVGLRLGHAVSIRESGYGGGPPVPMMRVMSAEQGEVPGGMFERVVTVEVSFELQEG